MDHCWYIASSAISSKKISLGISLNLIFQKFGGLDVGSMFKPIRLIVLYMRSFKRLARRIAFSFSMSILSMKIISVKFTMHIG